MDHSFKPQLRDESFILDKAKQSVILLHNTTTTRTCLLLMRLYFKDLSTMSSVMDLDQVHIYHYNKITESGKVSSDLCPS